VVTAEEYEKLTQAEDSAAVVSSRGYTLSGPRFFMFLALCHDGGTEAGAQVFGEFVKLGVAVDLNSLLGCVANHVAVMAPGEMVLQFALGLLVEDPVQVVRQLLQKLSAFHWMPSPLSRF
jgi:hypothetical protein